MEFEVKEEYRHLYEEFKKLNTTSEKIEFWNTRLPLNFIEIDECQDSDLLTALRPFRFEVAEQERHKVHQWILDNYLKLSSNPNKENRLFDLGEIIADFQLSLKEADHKIEFILQERYRIDSSFIPPQIQAGSLFNEKISYGTSKFLADYDTYIQYKEALIEPNLEHFRPYVTTTLKIANAVTLAKYRRFLDKELKRQEEFPESEEKEISLDQRLLILHYLGSLSKVMEANHATNQGQFLGQLLRTDPEMIRQRFSSINELITIPAEKEKAKRRKLKEDLEVIRPMFEKLRLQSIVKKIKADITKLKPIEGSKKL